MEGGGATGALCPTTQAERGPKALEYLLKNQYILIEQSRSRYSNRTVTIFFRGAMYSKLCMYVIVNKEIKLYSW